MKCPVCNDVRMREVVKDDVLIDVCPDCKGVWLDRGELEKLMQGVREVREDYERMEQDLQKTSPYGEAAPDDRAYPGPDRSRSAGYGAGQHPDYGAPPQGGFDVRHGAPPHAPQGGHYPPPPGYGQGAPGAYPPPQGQPYGKYGYDKYGRPKKKKTVLDVFGDLFD